MARRQPAGFSVFPTGIVERVGDLGSMAHFSRAHSLDDRPDEITVRVFQGELEVDVQAPAIPVRRAVDSWVSSAAARPP